MKTMKKRVMGLLLLAVLMMATFGISVNAASLDVDQYFYVSVGMEVSASSIRSGGSEISPWDQTVFAGSTVGASLARKDPSSTVTAPLSSYLTCIWKIYDANGQLIKSATSRTVDIPDSAADGHLTVTIRVSQHGDWATSSATSNVNID